MLRVSFFGSWLVLALVAMGQWSLSAPARIPFDPVRAEFTQLLDWAFLVVYKFCNLCVQSSDPFSSPSFVNLLQA